MLTQIESLNELFKMNSFINCLKNKPDSIKYRQEEINKYDEIKQIDSTIIPPIPRCILIPKIVDLIETKPPLNEQKIKMIEEMLREYKMNSMKEFNQIFSLCKNLQETSGINILGLFEKQIFKLSTNPINFLLKHNRFCIDYIKCISNKHLINFANHSRYLHYKNFIISIMKHCQENDEIEYKLPSFFYSLEFIYRLEYCVYGKHYNLGYCRWIDTLMGLHPLFFEKICVSVCKLYLPNLKEVLKDFPRTMISKAFEQIETFFCSNLYELVECCKEYNEKCLPNLSCNHSYISDLKEICKKEFNDFYESSNIKQLLNFFSNIPYACIIFSSLLYPMENEQLECFISQIKKEWTYNYNVYKFLTIFPKLHPLLNMPEILENQLKQSNFECYICLEPCVKPLQLECNHIFCEFCIIHLITFGLNQNCPVCRTNITIRLNQTDCLYKFPESI